MMQLLQRKKNAFTMIELIFVIIILGIVASIGSQIIVNVYSSYILERAQHRASIKTELAALQIANRLSSAIPGTVFRLKKAGGGFTYEPISDGFGTDTDYVGIQWVGSDIDSFSATLLPGWSGFCDINVSNASSIVSPASSIVLTDNIIQKLSGGTKTITDAKLYFYRGLTEHNITAAAGNTFTINSIPTGDILSERYKVAWTSYALIIDDEGDLYLYYDFPAIAKSTAYSKKSLIMHNIATFKFKGAGGSIRFKICKEEQISEDFNVTSCKEKAVF